MDSRIRSLGAKVLSLLPLMLLFASGPGIAVASDAACPRLRSLFPSPHVSALQIRGLFTDLTTGNEVQCKEYGPHQVQCASRTLPEVWIFTEPGHPAYPAVSRGIIVRRGTLTCVLRDGYFAGNKSAFAAWMAELIGYDNKLIARVRQQPR